MEAQADGRRLARFLASDSCIPEAEFVYLRDMMVLLLCEEFEKRTTLLLSSGTEL